MKRRWLAAGAAFLLLAGACAPPKNTGNVVLVSPTPSSPSPTPTPTTPFAATGSAFHAGEVGVAYAAAAPAASGGVHPYHWSVSSGALPPGLTLGGDGAVAGSPAAAGTFTFELHVTDSGDGSVSIPGTIKIWPRLTAGLLPACVQFCRVELGCFSVCGAFGTYGGGLAPYAFTLQRGPLPVGTALSASSLALNGTFAGQPGYLQITAQVRDALGGAAVLSPSFWMYTHIALPNATCSSGQPRLGTKCAVTIAYMGGTPGQKVSLAPTAWSPGSCSATAFVPCGQPAFSVSYAPGQVIVSLTYGANYPATRGTLTVRLTSSDPCGPGAFCAADATITVNG